MWSKVDRLKVGTSDLINTNINHYKIPQRLEVQWVQGFPI